MNRLEWAEQRAIEIEGADKPESDAVALVGKS
jgi:hypothetical protein